MLKFLAIVFGFLMIAIGVLGFLPDFTPGGNLLGIFMVNQWHNIIHLSTGVISLLCGLASGLASKIFFIIFGLVYGAIAIYGFMMGEGMLLNMVAINTADNWLHVGIAVVSLYLGLFLKSR